MSLFSHEPNEPVRPDDFKSAPPAMTLRQWYAGLAMQALVSKYGMDDASRAAGSAVKMADALIAELNKTRQQTGA